MKNVLKWLLPMLLFYGCTGSDDYLYINNDRGIVKAGSPRNKDTPFTMFTMEPQTQDLSIIYMLEFPEGAKKKDSCHFYISLNNALLCVKPTLNTSITPPDSTWDYWSDRFDSLRTNIIQKYAKESRTDSSGQKI